jgi:hypothetical protein
MKYSDRGFNWSKTSAQDHLVCEMLKVCNEEFFGVLALAFKMRLLNHTSEDDEGADNFWLFAASPKEL